MKKPPIVTMDYQRQMQKRNNYQTATNTCRPQRRDCIRRTFLRLSDGLTAKWSQ